MARQTPKHSKKSQADADILFLRTALRLARRGYGTTSPNPMVGAVLVQKGRIIGRGWHRRAGGPHAEIEALRDAQKHGHSPRGATLYVTLEPCCTHGRTPPCTEAIIAAGIRRVVVGATDPNPSHAGKGFSILRQAGITVALISGQEETPHLESPLKPLKLSRVPGAVPSPPSGERVRVRGRREYWHDALRLSNRRFMVRAAPAWPRISDLGPRPSDFPTAHGKSGRKLAEDCTRLNEVFNHWIVHRTPFVTVKAAMTLDGKIATASGESKWITGEKARAYGMHLRQGSDAMLVGVNTILADDPSLTLRSPTGRKTVKSLRRIVLDSLARTPLTARVVRDEQAAQTTIVVTRRAPKKRVAALTGKVNVLMAPQASSGSGIDLRWLLKKLGAAGVSSLLVEGGGEVNASFLLGGVAKRVAFFFAPKVLGGRTARKGVAGEGAKSWREVIQLTAIRPQRLGPDLLLLGRVG